MASHNGPDIPAYLQCTLPPRMLETVCGISQPLIRDWRRRGLLDDNIGQERNGRWSYSAVDLVLLAVAREVAADSAISLSFAFKISSGIYALCIIARVRGSRPHLPYLEVNNLADPRFFFFWPDKDNVGGINGTSATDVSKVFEKAGTTSVLALDADRVISRLPKAVINLIKNDLRVEGL